MNRTAATILMPNLSIGNFGSVLRMVEKAGGTAKLTSDPAELDTAEKVILAGVGAFDNGMEAVRNGWADALHQAVVVRKVPVLGICLGMQLMCEGSDEGRAAGLGWIPGRLQRFTPGPDGDLKVPHMGWNTVSVREPNALVGDGDRFYFVHSYYLGGDMSDHVVATAHHGVTFAAAIVRDNVFGVQFHPEKSHRFGLALLKRFVEL